MALDRIDEGRARDDDCVFAGTEDGPLIRREGDVTTAWP